jgi:tRNA (adenine22-N1)-methyltransferase
VKHRLQRILQILASNTTQHRDAIIWDFCCDHGDLAIAIAETIPGSKVVALDVVPDIIDRLNHKLSSKYVQVSEKSYQIYSSVLTTSCLDAKLASTNELDLAIICGIGTDLIIDILNSIKNKPQHLILCSHKNPVKLRNYLQNSPWGILSEHLIYDRGQYYECYFMDQAIHEKISSIGSHHFWQQGERAMEYLNRRTHELSLKNKTPQVLQEFEQLNEIKLNVLK